jgi:hypothetical protein
MAKDLIIRIALVQDDDRELNPSIWRRVRVSSDVHLDVLHDKILTPVMGWTRNHHTYIFWDDDVDNSDGVVYSEMETGANDAMHLHTGDKRAEDASELKLRDLLSEEGDTCHYTRDLGDGWRHLLTVERVVYGPDVTGAVELLDGTMRCPDEDGEGCRYYQDEILDHFNQVKQNPHDDDPARWLAGKLYTQQKRSAFNVMGRFRVDDFDLEKHRAALTNALHSRASTMSSKYSNNTKTSMFLGDRSPFVKIPKGSGRLMFTHNYEIAPRCGGGSGEGFRKIVESIATKADELSHSLCWTCGSPGAVAGATPCTKLLHCGSCKVALYCNTTCQKKDWKSCHKGSSCKAEKELRLKGDTCEGELVVGEPLLFNVYDADSIRFKVGDSVECRIHHPGGFVFGRGHVSNTNVCRSKQQALVPYVVELDNAKRHKVQRGLFFIDCDHDFWIRRLAPPCKHVAVDAMMKNMKNMEIVD